MTKIPEPKTLTGNPALVHAGFDELPHNPLHLLQNWFCDAIKLNVSEPGGLVLSTVDSNGKPFSRVVLLKTIDATGVIFASNSNSKKGIDISNNTSVAGTLWWRETMQQVNASHMVAIVEKHAEGKIEWNKRAINLTEQTKDERCHAWLGPIYNNLAQNYIEAEKYLEALQSFEKCKAHAEERGDQIVIRGALWGVGRALRGLNKLDQALDVQNDLLKDYEKIAEQGLLPMELICVGRGLVYEELAEIHFAKESDEQSQKYARLAYEDLSKDAWMKKLYPERIQRLLELGKL